MGQNHLLSNRYHYGPLSKSVYPDTPERQAGVARLLRKMKNGQYRVEDMPCPCGAHRDQVLAERDRFAIPMTTVICRSCGLVRTNPRMDEASYIQFYDQEFRDIATLEKYSGNNDRVHAIHAKERHFAAQVYAFIAGAPGIKGFAGSDGPKARVADVGCGSGGMVGYFADRGHSAAGSDYDSGFVSYGKAQGLDLVVGSADALVEKGPFDVVILSHVFEHVTSPFGMLDSLIRLMRPGSALYIELPGILDISMGRYRNDFLRYLRFVHTLSFSLSTLTNLVESRGFKLVRGDERIYAVFVYQKSPPQAMRPLESQYNEVIGYLRRIERRRFLYPAYAPYAVLRNSAVRVLDALGLKAPLKRILRGGN